MKNEDSTTGSGSMPSASNKPAGGSIGRGGAAGKSSVIVPSAC